MSTHPQLRMRAKLDVLSAPKPLPDGYVLRQATPDDAEQIAVVLSEAFEEPWTADRVHEVLLDDPNVPITFVIEFTGQIVATASYQVKPDEFPNAGWVHYVGARRKHSGKGLGYAVCHPVIAECQRNGHDSVYLTTDDHRLPAIRTYFRLGFRPDPCDPSHDARWLTVGAEIRAVSSP